MSYVKLDTKLTGKRGERTMKKFKYRVHPKGCRPGSWYVATGNSIDQAMMNECRNGVTEGMGAVRVEVEDHGFWLLKAETQIVCTARPAYNFDFNEKE